MVSRRSWRALWVSFVLLLGMTVGCEFLFPFDRSKIDGGGSGGTTASGGSTGATTASGGATGGTTTTSSTSSSSSGPCKDPATDCSGDPGECRVWGCDADDQCVPQPAQDGVVAQSQIDGDCNTKVCQSGMPTDQPADDPLDDFNACTTDSCDAGNPVSTPTAVGSACSDGIKTVCDGNGLCVECNSDADCNNGVWPVCSNNVCTPATCNDSKKNGDETDIDCGGSCNPCGDLLACKLPGDCESGVCTGQVCQVPKCNDGVKNGTEGDIDCGAACPGKGCGPMKGCNGDADCAGLQCTGAMNGTCVPNCNDQVKNNAESDIDCGGGTCGGCPVGKQCNNADTNCVVTAYCTGTVCAAKQPQGTACIGSNQCNSGACADTVCCDNTCNGTCSACVAAKTGQPTGSCAPITVNTDPDNECAGNGGTDVCDGSGACAKAKGTACGGAGECATGNCVDGFCCDQFCGALCKACSNAKTGQPNGTCSNVTINTDPDNECAGSLSCTGGACSTPLADGSACTVNAECANNHCVDGVCCNVACGGSCQACSAVKKGQGNDGACGPIKSATDPDNECAGALSCNGSGACNQAVGATCAGANECASGNCVDAVCCFTICAGLCQTCTGAGGICVPLPAGADPANECNGAAPNNNCNGVGACGAGASGVQCAPGAAGACAGGLTCPAGGVCP